ncbi:MAG: PAS domain S-box protein [Nitrosomonadales bacterium]|nr:PAS domain S-box protein [Nitrosomonadales bacterium]
MLENALRVNSEELTAINEKLRANSELELANQRALLHEIIDSIPDFIFIKDTNSVYLGCNRALEEFFGASESEIIGKTDFDFVDVELAAFCRQKDQEMLALNRPCTSEEWVTYLDGRRACLEILKTPYLSADGTLLGLIGVGRDITERKWQEAALLESEGRFRDIVEFAPIGMGIAALDDGRFVQVNQALCNLLGYTKKELEQLTTRDITHPDDWAADVVFKRQLLAGEIQGFQNEKRLLHRGGRVVWVHLTVVIHRNLAGIPLFFIGQVEDMSGRREALQREHFMSVVLDNVFDGVVTIDERGLVDSFNKSAERIFGYDASEVIGRNISMLMPEPHRTAHDSYVRNYLETAQSKIVGIGREVVGRRKDGRLFPLDIAVSEVEEGGVRRFIGVVRDITERKSVEERMNHLAHYDALTDLPNRALFDDRLSQALVIARRDDLNVALMFVDLDKFKPVNDTFGHQIGDLLLVEVAQRLRECLRDSDTAARIGGDEFVVLLQSIEEKADAIVVAEKIRQSLCLPFELGGHQIHISASIGVAVNLDQTCDEKRLTKKADIAMYHAKAKGRNNATLYQPDMDGDWDWAI